MIMRRYIDIIEEAEKQSLMEDKKHPDKYFKGLSKKEKEKRKKEFERNAKKDDDDDSAYDPMTGDDGEDTKKSKYTKEYNKKFGESVEAVKNKAEETGIPYKYLKKGDYIVYLTVNMINGKSYIGYHQCTTDGFDGYIGSGKILSNAIQLYGRECFVRYNIERFDNEYDARNLEQEILVYLDASSNRSYYNVKNSSVGFSSEDATKHWRKYYESDLYLYEHREEKSKKRTYMNSLDTAPFKNSDIQRELSKRAHKARNEDIKNNPEKYSEIGRKGASALSWEQRSLGGKISGKRNAESGHLQKIASSGGKAGGKATIGMKFYTNIHTGQWRRFRPEDVPNDTDWIRGMKKIK